MKKSKILLAAAPFLLAGCLGDPVEREVKTAFVAVVVNNGTGGNGSVNYYFEGDGILDKEPLSNKIEATYRSAQLLGEYLYVVTNEPDALLHYDIMGRQAGYPVANDILKTPRFATADQSYLYVSNWGTKDEATGEYLNAHVTVLDRWGHSLRKTLDCGSGAEGILAYKDRLFVATKDSVEVFNISNESMGKEPSIKAASLTGHAKRFAVDSLGMVWVSYTGGGLLSFDPASSQILHEVSNVPVDSLTGAIAVTTDGKKIISYANSETDAVITATNISSGEIKVLVQEPYHITAIGVSPFTNDIFIAHTPSGGSASTLIVFDENGVKKAEKEVGPNTGHITFFGYYY
jgi:hypothetical protein